MPSTTCSGSSRLRRLSTWYKITPPRKIRPCAPNCGFCAALECATIRQYTDVKARRCRPRTSSPPTPTWFHLRLWRCVNSDRSKTIAPERTREKRLWRCVKLRLWCIELQFVCGNVHRMFGPMAVFVCPNSMCKESAHGKRQKKSKKSQKNFENFLSRCV